MQLCFSIPGALGLTWDAWTDRLIVVDVHLGIYSVDTEAAAAAGIGGDDGREWLVTRRELPRTGADKGGKVHRFFHSAVVTGVNATSHIVYFTHTSDRFSPLDTAAALLHGGADGVVYAFDFETRRTTVVAAGLHHPTGVAFAIKGDSVDYDALLVAETTRHRVVSVGARSLHVKTWLDLPCAPSSLTRDSSRLLVACVSGDRHVASRERRRLATRYPALALLLTSGASLQATIVIASNKSDGDGGGRIVRELTSKTVGTAAGGGARTSVSFVMRYTTDATAETVATDSLLLGSTDAKHTAVVRVPYNVDWHSDA
jgi:hypothetical protein